MGFLLEEPLAFYSYLFVINELEKISIFQPFRYAVSHLLLTGFYPHQRNLGHQWDTDERFHSSVSHFLFIVKPTPEKDT